MAMQLWGKWYHRDIAAHLGRSADSVSAGDPPMLGGEGNEGEAAMGFDAHSWLRVCGVACAVGKCTRGRRERAVEPCASWVLSTPWHANALEAYTRRGGHRRAGHAASPAAASQTSPQPQPQPPLTPSEKRAATFVATQVSIPPALAAGVASATTTHPKGLIAFRTPLATADRREYQLYVHLLMSAAMVTSRVPVLPLALCAAMGEWGERSRCVYVMHASDGQRWCVQRPPSICHGKVALPNALNGLSSSEVATVHVPRLPLLNGTVHVEAFGAALGGGSVASRVLLLDTSLLSSADDVGNLLATPKGWLCTLEHKSCQHAC